MICPCCQSDDLTTQNAELAPFVSHRTGRAKDCHSVICGLCSFVFCDIRFDDREMNALYEDYRGGKYTSLREQYEPGYRRRNEELLRGDGYAKRIENFILPYVKPERVLDWGGDTGVNTPFLGSCVVHIYDIGTNPVKQGALKVDKPQETYDIVVCRQVLEHVPDPLYTLQEMMKYADYLYVDVPKDDLYSKMWHEHINRFTEKSMLHLLIDTEIISTQSDIYLQYLVRKI